jgi:hypothetical protein
MVSTNSTSEGLFNADGDRDVSDTIVAAGGTPTAPTAATAATGAAAASAAVEQGSGGGAGSFSFDLPHTLRTFQAYLGTSNSLKDKRLGGRLGVTTTTTTTTIGSSSSRNNNNSNNNQLLYSAASLGGAGPAAWAGGSSPSPHPPSSPLISPSPESGSASSSVVVVRGPPPLGQRLLNACLIHRQKSMGNAYINMVARLLRSNTESISRFQDAVDDYRGDESFGPCELLDEIEVLFLEKDWVGGVVFQVT